MTAAEPYARKPGDEPLPGYTITRPLGRGGFGEVWACVAPGGLKKAVKFVSAGVDGEAAQFHQELDAFERIKEIRHPFLLSLERVEVVGSELVMVMELADQQLQDRFNDCRAAGLRGIPRAELVAYLTEAAEALDVISEQFGLQHLDVKPANLFVTAGHVKVGDYGLVASLDAVGSGNRGLTPKFVAPETLRGSVHTRSDQYSLALVYCELLTGVFPYPAKTPQQMMLAHVSSQPDVSALPGCDRGPVWTALQKRPEDRFRSCLEFVRALREADYHPADEPPQPPAPPAAGRSTVVPLVTRVGDTTPPAGEVTGRYPCPPVYGEGPRPEEMAPSPTWRTVPRLVQPGVATPGPRLVTPGMSNPGARLVPPGSRPGTPLPPLPPPAAPARGSFAALDEDLPVAEPARLRVNPIRSVIPAGLLRGETLPKAGVAVVDFAHAVVGAAAGGARVPQLPGDLGRTADGAWVCQFPSTVPAQVVPLKLSVLQGAWAVAVEQPEPGLVVLRRTAAGGGWFSKKKTGFVVEVRLPKPGKSLGEVTVTGFLTGDPDRQFVQVATDAIPRLVADVRRELGNVDDRRKHPRLATTMPVTVHPLHSDGTPDAPVRGACVDVSVGGLAFSLQEPITTKYAYLEFDAVPEAAGLAVLVRVVRSVSSLGARDAVYGVQYRTDL
ncbi:MAG TPA: serine/threonine-protein kinase [Urbifossiella sp.]|nr:serine/threonine-protein kinase [Urbifossiella sp.]